MSDGASIGQLLRLRREERGLTVEQAAYQSKVPLRLLQALESDDYHLLPDPMYLVRFLHEYALFLKLDPGALHAEFQEATRRPPKTSLAVAPPPAPVPAIPWKQVIWTAAAIVVVTPLVFIALSLSSRRPPETPPVAPEVVRSGDEQLPENGGGGMPDRNSALRADSAPGPRARGQDVAETIPKVPETSGARVSVEHSAGSVGVLQASRSTGAEPRSPGQFPTPSPPGTAAAARLLLTIRASEPAWVSVRSDTAGRRQVLLRSGQATSFEADKGFLITLGNAGGVELSLNGVRMPVPGKSGEVIRDLPIPPVQSGNSPSPPVQ